ncbi:ABC transporter ATP-binding protein [Stappia indica]|uniref:ABC transporter ATP-binding protein n=1 Tax=Stappia indica TaxID=538381 RepID=UPI001CD1F956|nr:ABC transporter ATP-binding protein [Stappia indica]MCA1299570.1 ABC transporter ATP-binding protein [Stappia indica]
MSDAPLLDIRDLGLKAVAGPLVEGFNLTVERGEMVGLVGESGCGKTVTALSILGLLPHPAVQVSAGRILFRGTDLTTLDEPAMNGLRGNRIAMIFQEPMTSLNPIMTIGDQIGEVLALHRRLDGAACARETARLLDMVGLPGTSAQQGRYPFQLSGGQRQRVMIAMALACEPDLLIADEPTTALDVTVQAQILELIKEMQERLGMGCILVTHDLGVVADICDRAVVMYAGRIIESGKINALFGAPMHRYTRALLDTIPGANPPGQDLPAIPGSVPPPGERPSGCAFTGRCSAALDRCGTDLPPAINRADHHVFCWNPAS